MEQSIDNTVTQLASTTIPGTAVMPEVLHLLSSVETRQRQELAAELHDGLGQLLICIKMQLDRIHQETAGCSQAGQLETLRDLLGQCIRYTRTLTNELYVPGADEDDLPVLIQRLAEAMLERYGLTVHIDDTFWDGAVNTDITQLLYGGVRELLINCGKHAGVHDATVRLAREQQTIHIEVRDDGCGFDPASIMQADGMLHTFGLRYLHERIAVLGGSLQITAQPDNGTQVSLSIPFVEPAREGDQVSCVSCSSMITD